MRASEDIDHQDEIRRCKYMKFLTCFRRYPVSLTGYEMVYHFKIKVSDAPFLTREETIPADTRLSPNVDLTLAQPTLNQHWVNVLCLLGLA